MSAYHQEKIIDRYYELIHTMKYSDITFQHLLYFR